MRKNAKLWTVLTIAFGLFACNPGTNDIDNPTASGTPGAIGDAETYATIRVAMPGGSALKSMIKAGNPETGDGEETGEGNENTFNSVALYFFNTTECVGVLNIPVGQFASTSNPEDKSVVYALKDPMKVGIEGENMSVYAVVNGTIAGVNTGTSLDAFLVKTVARDAAIQEQNGGALSAMLMTSRKPDVVTISATANGTAATAAQLQVSVERTAAKVTFAATNANKYEVKDTEGQTVLANVEITDYKLVNLRNDAYYFRKVGAGAAEGEKLTDGDQTGANYVIDPYFYKKTAEAAAAPDFYTTWFGADKAYAANPAENDGYTALPTATTHTLLGYCMENTMAQAVQFNGYSTGVVFKAVYKPVTWQVWNAQKNTFETGNYTAGSTFYRYADVIYNDKEALKKYFNIGDAAIDTYTGDASTGGAPCYYKYWIRHNDNGNAEVMDVMEFTIVRNNAYKLDIQGVSGLGEPTDEIDPIDPDETSKMFLDVEVTILPWVVRNNSIIL